MRLLLENNMSYSNIMNRRQQPAPARPPTQRQTSRTIPQQQQHQHQQVPQYNPNSVGKQLPPQVTIPQAISILVARINQLEDKCAAPTTPTTIEVPVPVVDTKQMEEMASRIVKLEMELLSAKDHIMKLQSFTLNMAVKPQVAPLNENESASL